MEKAHSICGGHGCVANKDGIARHRSKHGSVRRCADTAGADQQLARLLFPLSEVSVVVPVGKKLLVDSCLKGSAEASNRKASNSHEMKHFRSRAQCRQETLFKRFKEFGILRQRFRHGLDLHRMVLGAVAVIVQYAMENGQPLFDV